MHSGLSVDEIVYDKSSYLLIVRNNIKYFVAQWRTLVSVRQHYWADRKYKYT